MQFHSFVLTTETGLPLLPMWRGHPVGQGPYAFVGAETATHFWLLDLAGSASLGRVNGGPAWEFLPLCERRKGRSPSWTSSFQPMALLLLLVVELRNAYMRHATFCAVCTDEMWCI